jgi:hypothetical protein
LKFQLAADPLYGDILAMDYLVRLEIVATVVRERRVIQDRVDIAVCQVIQVIADIVVYLDILVCLVILENQDIVDILAYQVIQGNLVIVGLV